MAKVDRSGMTGGGVKMPKLTVETFRELTNNPKARKTVVTITAARRFKFEDGDESVFVASKEYPEHEIAFGSGTQKSSLLQLVDAGKLPDDQRDDGTFAWEGVRLPLLVQEFPYQGKKYEKWVAVHPDDYDDAIAAYDKAMAGKK